MKIVKKIRADSIIPALYGVAWIDVMTHTAICLPVPFNALVALVRAVWIFARFGWRPVHMNPRSAYNQGLRDGKKVIRIDCCEYCGRQPSTEEAN